MRGTKKLSTTRPYIKRKTPDERIDFIHRTHQKHQKLNSNMAYIQAIRALVYSVCSHLFALWRCTLTSNSNINNRSAFVDRLAYHLHLLRINQNGHRSHTYKRLTVVGLIESAFHRLKPNSALSCSSSGIPRRHYRKVNRW